jgi:hypothetical protein
MFKSFPRRAAKTICLALAAIAITVCTAGASEAATVSKTVPPSTREVWVYIETFHGAPGGAVYFCSQAGQSYINEGLASQYNCETTASGTALYILTLAG